jgi:hypothetical protein
MSYWSGSMELALIDAITEAASAAVAEAVAERDAQACEEVAAALRRENPPLAEAYVFDQLQLRVDLRHCCAEAVAEERTLCINAICPFCRGDFPNYAPAEQMDYGAWLHSHVDGIDNDWVPCEAALIRVTVANLEGDKE